LKLYFDTSFLVPLVFIEPTCDVVRHFISIQPSGAMFASHWNLVEFASMLGREVRMGSLNTEEAGRAMERFRNLLAQSFTVVVPTQDDFTAATRMIATFQTGLRAGDALHLAIAENNHASMF
jgi:predicted nucleic acid-binding protein